MGLLIKGKKKLLSGIGGVGSTIRMLEDRIVMAEELIVLNHEGRISFGSQDEELILCRRGCRGQSQLFARSCK
jgi:hypothetical protein